MKSGINMGLEKGRNSTTEKKLEVRVAMIEVKSENNSISSLFPDKKPASSNQKIPYLKGKVSAPGKAESVVDS